MLFALDSNGTPSVASTISITNVATQPPSNNYGKAVFAAGPSTYWPLNDTSGHPAADSSGNGDTGNYSATGVTYGAASPVEATSGKGVTLNGSSGQIVASQPITNPTTYSEEMWFKTTATTGGYLMGFGTSPSGESVSRDRQVWMSDSGQLNFGIYDNAPISIQSPKAYNDGFWHQVVATQGPDGINLYVDGQLVTSSNTSAPPQNYLGYWRVGFENASGWNGSPTNNYFAGTISDVAFYNSELSSSQVQTQFGASLAPLPPGVCPKGWSCPDIGGALPPGQDSLNNGTWNEVGGGGDIWDTSDSFHFVSQSVTGDTTVTAHVTAQQPTDPWAKAGVMLRATTDPSSPYYAAFVTPGNGIAVQWRSAQGGFTSQVTKSGTVPAYLRVARFTSGTTTYFTAYTSPDGTNWSAVGGSTQTLSLGQPLLAGLAITSHNQGVGSAVTFDTVSVAAGATAPPGVCPTGWSCADLGAPTPPGGQSLAATTWTIQGGGGDIWDVSDSFHYIWNTLAADGSISAQVTSQTNSDPWAKAGVMLRATTNPGSPYYAVFVTPGNGITVQWRSSQGALTSNDVIAGTVPRYLRVTRAGATYTASTSSDGTTWTTVPGSSTTLANLTGSLLRGLAVTSHNTGTTSTVVMNSVVATP
jgi:hypothetical protein